MSVDVRTPAMTWAQRLARSITSKVPASMNNKTILGKRIELEFNTISEDSDIKNLLRVYRAESIIQQTFYLQTQFYLK